MRRYLPIPAVLLSTLMAADLPVRDVILYKNGVAYFQRGGDLKAGEAARLDFKAAEMNDVLKSLTVADGAGGKVTAVRYDSAEPLDKKLSEFPVRIGAGQPLSAFLDQMRGVHVTLKYGTETIGGAIATARVISSEREQLTMLLDSGDLRSVDLAGIASIHFDDPAIEKQLKAYLGVVSEARSADRRNVYIDSTGGTGGRITASYMIPSPVWKSSYRLIFAGSGDATLEGWAIVDNTTADDWSGVRLALVSGRPVSFISRLYEPRYRNRPTVDLAEDRAVGPVVYSGAMDEQKAKVMAQAAPAPARMQSQQRMELSSENQFRIGGNAGGGGVFRSDAFSTIAVNTAGQEVGELFEYRFSNPVTIKRGESAMLPFIQDKVSARKLIVYSDESAQNPMNAALITNSTGKTLDGGPITVYDAGTYGGEALVETLKAGDKRLISYALDLGTRITTAIDSQRDFIREVHFRRGVMTTKSAVQETKTYTIHNVDQKEKTLVIEHPLRPGFKLLNMKPMETTARAYRFEVKVAPDSTQKFAVTEENVYDNSIDVRNQNPDLLMTYIRNKAISDDARNALQRILDEKALIAASAAEITRLEAESADAERDQSRLRQNVDSLNRVSGQEQMVQQYARQIGANETKLAALRDQVNEQRRKKQTLEAALNKILDETVF